jgi:hypothetical protein
MGQHQTLFSFLSYPRILSFFLDQRRLFFSFASPDFAREQPFLRPAAETFLFWGISLF